MKIETRAVAAETLEAQSVAQIADRIWRKDTSLWSSRADVQRRILNRLGWLDAVKWARPSIERLQRFANQVREDGFTNVVLLGMGGSSLAPEVLNKTFGSAPGYLQLEVLDTTAPDAIHAVEKKVSLPSTLFLVSSKSGTTAETMSLFEYFYHRLEADKPTPGDHFVAITDAGTPLQQLAKQRHFRDCFLAPADVGGRYSALTFFGMLPAALLGIDLEALVSTAVHAADNTKPTTNSAENFAIHLGSALADLALNGRDKLTLLLSPRITSLGAWIEQLIAESTGKEQQGIIPVDNPIPGSNHADQVFVSITTVAEQEPGITRKLDRLGKLGHPVFHWSINDASELAGEFFRWEFTTAVAAYKLGINPFDEPDVVDAKTATNKSLEALKSGALVTDAPTLYSDNVCAWYGDKRYLDTAGDPIGPVNKLAAEVRPGDYLAILAYLPPSPEVDARLYEIRRLLEERFGIVTCLAYGPRYLHSSGQLHKGGPNSGIYLQVTAEPEHDLPIPGQGYSFHQLITAQAAGDFDVLTQRGRRILRVHLRGSVVAALEALSDVL
jgi:glucose-6-phosphate isomerase